MREWIPAFFSEASVHLDCEDGDDVGEEEVIEGIVDVPAPLGGLKAVLVAGFLSNPVPVVATGVGCTAFEGVFEAGVRVNVTFAAEEAGASAGVSGRIGSGGAQVGADGKLGRQ